MEIHEIKEKEIWQKFAASFEMAQFLHSWQWGEFQQNLGRKIWRLGFFKNNEMVGASLLIKMPLPMKKSYLYCSRGPLIANSKEQIANSLLEKIKEITQKENSIFLRFEPPIIENWKLSRPKSGSAFGGKIENCRRVNDVQPSRTILLDLTKPEDEILTAMHYKTRYNIRLAEKKGVVVRQGKEEDIKTFIKLISETAKRDSFKPHPLVYYQKLLNLDQDFVKLYLAEYQGKILAGNLMIYFGDTCSYSHGASSNEYKNVMAPHLLQWHCICQAKKLGYKYYDFWGIDEKKWPGVTRFKKGFTSSKTSHEISYPGTFDLVLDKFWYKLYQFGRFFKNF